MQKFVKTRRASEEYYENVQQTDTYDPNVCACQLSLLFQLSVKFFGFFCGALILGQAVYVPGDRQTYIYSGYYIWQMFRHFLSAPITNWMCSLP